MNKYMIAAIVGVAVLALVGYFFLRNPQSPEENTVSDNMTDRIAESAAFMGLDANSPIICEYNDENYETTAYIANGKVRVDSVSEGETTHALIDGDTVYFWNPGTNEAYMMTVTEDMQQLPEGAPNTPFSRDEVESELERQEADCRNENFDTGILTPPTDIEFQDFSTMMEQQMQQMEGEAGEIPQDVRDQIPEEYQQYLPQ